jgi:D-lyxose ketol-isomerase
MSNTPEMSDRRELMKTALAATGAAALACTGVNAGEAATAPKPSISFKNSDFLDAKGQFALDKAKDAIEALCRYHGYPIFPKFRDNLWVSDYGLGKFAEVGLAAYLFVNNVKDQYMMLDIFLLPNQMLPEHWHVEGEGNPAKREGWLVRWGLSHIVGIGDENLPKQVNVPKAHWDGKVTVKHEVAATPGMFVPLSEVGTRHWQYGGPEGAIVTEVANVHTNSAVRHTDPAMNKYFLEH